MAAINAHGVIIECGWTRGIEETMSWLDRTAVDGSTLAFVDAPLVVDNPSASGPASGRSVGGTAVGR
ncbi:hypothetical protein [Streptomyces sp. NPDC093984]|uniref:hypothetical protein n=1 Tax=Streptomyces sp. NPDC093984 TaxID=3366052 RepID=UPI00380819FC